MGWDYNDTYGAASGLLEYLQYVNNDPATNTGIQKSINLLNALVGKPPNILLSVVIGRQIALVGGYPTLEDTKPSEGCAAMYGVLALFHFIIFIVDFSRGHYFYITLGWILVCSCRIVGFALRASWSREVTLIDTALASEFFLIFATIIDVSFNLMLAQRLFSWRHPVGGSRRGFVIFMLFDYIAILFFAAATIFCHAIPYKYPLSRANFNKYWDFEIATLFLIIFYVATTVALIALSIVAPTKNDENLYTYQPWWIKSFAFTYFPEKNAAQKAEKTFMKRNSNHRHTVRVIAATKHRYKVVEGLSNDRGDLRHNISMLILVVSTLIQLVATIGRCILCTQRRPASEAAFPILRIFMYLSWGGLEALMQVIYIVGRVDLRFYRPDVLPQAVRDIITAQQSKFATTANTSINSPYNSESDQESCSTFHLEEYKKHYITNFNPKSDDSFSF